MTRIDFQAFAICALLAGVPAAGAQEFSNVIAEATAVTPERPDSTAAAEAAGTLQVFSNATPEAPAVAAETTDATESAEAADTSTETTDAYIALVQADGARDRQDWKDAISGYRDALARYQRIAKSRPDWQPDVVQYRISYCENQIDAAIRSAGRTENRWDGGATSAAPERVAGGEPASSTYRERYFALMQENQYIRQRLAEMEEQVRQSEAGAIDTNALDQLRVENAQLREQLAAAPVPKEAPVESEPKQDEIAAKLKELVDENETLRSKLEEMQAKDLEAKVDQMDEELRKAEQERAALVRENKKLKAAVERAKSSRPEDEMAALMQAGLAQERDRSLAAALSLYERASAMRPSNEQAVLARCRCLLNMGRVNEAVTHLQNLIAAGRGGIDARFLLGSGFCAAGVYDKAAAVLRSVVRDDPSNAAARNALGAALMGLGQLDEAYSELEKAVSMDETLADAHYNLAQILACGTSADIEESKAQLLRAQELGVAP